MHLKSIKNYFK